MLLMMSETPLLAIYLVKRKEVLNSTMKILTMRIQVVQAQPQGSAILHCCHSSHFPKIPLHLPMYIQVHLQLQLNSLRIVFDLNIQPFNNQVQNNPRTIKQKNENDQTLKNSCFLMKLTSYFFALQIDLLCDFVTRLKMK